MLVSHQWLDQQHSVILRQYVGNVSLDDHMQEMVNYQRMTSTLHHPFDLIVDLSQITNLNVGYSGLLTSVLKAVRIEEHKERLTVVFGANRYASRILKMVPRSIRKYAPREVVFVDTYDEVFAYLNTYRAELQESLELLA